MYLHDFENYTQYLNDLIDKDRLDRLDKSYINSKRAELKAELQKLDDLEKTKQLDQGKIHEILKYHATNYKENAQFRSDTQRVRFIEKSIMPQLKKLGYKGSPQDIDRLLMNWPGG